MIIKIKIFIIIILFGIAVIHPIRINSDFSNGEFAQDSDNDAPIFITWFDAQTLIDPDTDVLFTATINDIDNGSSELTILIFYSTDTFAIDINNASMNFANSPATNQYYFTYLFPGESSGVYYQYYYQAMDGSNTIKQPLQTGIYFDIQWDLIIAGGSAGGGDGRRAIIHDRYDYPIFITVLLILGIIVYLNRNNFRNERFKSSNN